MRLWPFKRTEAREDWGERIMASYMTEAETGGVDISRLAVAEACAGIVGRCFAACRVDGADMLTPDQLDILGRSLILRGEYIGLLTASGGLVPVSSADVLGRDADPMSWGYRCQYSTPSAGTMTVVAPADAVLHVRTGASRSAPWRGRSPLSGAMSDVELAAGVGRSLQGEARVKNHVYLHPPQSDTGGRLTEDQIDTLTSKVAQTPNGKTLLMSEPLHATRTRPDPSQALDEARRTSCMEIAAACGVPPVLLQAGGDGNSAREAYRRLTRATIEPLGRLLAHEASMKLGAHVTLHFSALRASDVAMNARAFAALVSNGIEPSAALELSGLAEA